MGLYIGLSTPGILALLRGLIMPGKAIENGYDSGGDD